MVYLVKLKKPLSLKEKKLIDEITNDFIINKKGGNNYFINYKNIKNTDTYLHMVNTYMNGIHNVIYNNDDYHDDYDDNHDKNSANLNTKICDDNHNILFYCKIRSIKNEKIIIGTYDAKKNNYSHISFFKDGFIHITFIIPPSKSAGGSPFKIYYNIPPDINNNWDDLETMLKNLYQLLFIDNIINDNTNEFWNDNTNWNELLFSINEKKNVENKEFIEKQLHQLLQVIELLKQDEKYRINVKYSYKSRSRSKSRS